MTPNSRGDLRLTFLGAAGCVTGAKFLLEAGGEGLLVDCGMFQGERALRRRNWDGVPREAEGVAGVVLTHAHIDHSGMLPRLVRQGYRGPILATAATGDLLGLLLRDSARLQEEEAAWANRRGYSKHSPARPLFGQKDVERALRQVTVVGYRTPTAVGTRFRVSFRGAGHILGSAVVVVEVDAGEERPVRVVFSGDIGRYDAPILRDPMGVSHADWLVVESTYGGRRHPPAEEAVETLARVVRDATERGGVVLVPAFAVGRTQTLLYLLRELEDAGRIPRLPVFVDSPMAVAASEFYASHREEHDAETRELRAAGARPLFPDGIRFCESVRESKALNAFDGPGVIVSASGMLTGGRVLHHAAARLPHARNTVLLAGYQAAWTRGRRLVEGEPEVKIHGEMVPVRARIETLDGLSAHGDEDELIRWASVLREPPRRTFVVHGEPRGSRALAARLRHDLGFETATPALDEAVTLSRVATARP